MDNVLWLPTLVFMIVISPSKQQCEQFTEISVDQYNRNYYSINQAEDSDRPLGFLKSTVIYQRDELPCFSVSGGETGQYLEIKFETVPTMLLCVREKTTGETFCDDGRHSSCRGFIKETMEYEFYCATSEGCAEADVNFWVRITKGPKPADDTEAMWCFDELDNNYPEGLRSLPPGFTPRPETEKPIGGATSIIISLSVVMTTTFMTILLS